MATSSSSFSLAGSNTGGSTLKLCLFCLSPADYIPDKSNGNGGGGDWTKSYFRQFLWKYLIGDDMVKINEFTGNQLKSTVPPLCVGCHDKCLQLASYHVEFENIQEEIMQVTKDLLEGWKGRETLFTKAEYDNAVQQCQRETKGRPKMPTHRFIKSPGGGAGGAYPALETIQMYQILRNPGHVRIPLSCLKSFGFTELKNLMSKNSTVAKQILAGPKIPSPSIIQAKAAAAAAAAKLLNANNNISISKVNNTLSNITQAGAKKYWINDVQVEMLGFSGNSNDEDGEDYLEDGDEEDEDTVQNYSISPTRKLSPSTTKLQHNRPPPPPMKPAYVTSNMKSLAAKFTPPVPALKQMPALGIAPKRPKLEMEVNAPETVVDRFYDEPEEDEVEDNNCVNFLEIVGNNGKQYEADEDANYTDSPEESQYYYEDENGEEMYSDGDGGMYEDDSNSPHNYYNGRPSFEMDEDMNMIVGGDVSNQKKRKRVFVLRKGNWTQEEDEMISKIVTETGPKNWSKVAVSLGTGRTGKQIRERWTHHLNPEVNKQPWSDQEDLVLMQAHARWGNQWSRISKLLPGRTDNAVKNHWNGTLKRKAQLLQLGTVSQN